MPSLVGTTVAANYRRVKTPYSNFGTRQLAFFIIGSIPGTTLATDNTAGGATYTGNSYGVYTGDDGIYDAAGNVVVPATYVWSGNSFMNHVVEGVQVLGELAFMGAVSLSSTTATVTVGLFIDTLGSTDQSTNNTGNQPNSNAQTLQAAIRAAGLSGATVVPAFMVGGTLLSNSGIMTSTVY
jgi:hypothetical protein